MTEKEARELTDEVRREAAALWGKLLRLYEGNAHTALGYGSWGAYFEAEFGKSRGHAYRLLKAARVHDELSLHVETRGMTEAHTRLMARLSPERATEVARTVNRRGGWEHVSAPELQAIMLPDDLTGTIRTRAQAPFTFELGKLIGVLARSDRERILSEVRAVSNLPETLKRIRLLRQALEEIEEAAAAAEGQPVGAAGEC